MIRRITIEDLVNMPQRPPVADVRSPAEFQKAHIPGAFSLPLFSNEERAQVGTTYKQQSREAAILLGFDLAGPKWSGFIRTALEKAPDKKIVVHCWRGGMRSGAMAWALDLYGFQVFLVDGGYKRFRRWVLEQFEKPWPLTVIGGMTGSGKTRILHELHNRGEQTIDLEYLAQHQGSSFGTLGRLIQPSTEQFENLLATQLHKLDDNRRIWIEDESLNIGKNSIPRNFWDRMQRSPLFDMQVPKELRIKALTEEYGPLDKDFLVECTERIRKRLGPEQTKRAVAAIREDRMEDFVREVLVYYDKTYRTGLSGHTSDSITPIPVQEYDAMANASLLLEATQTEKIWTK
jgi:tRNA 2-selenouridine synthase